MSENKHSPSSQKVMTSERTTQSGSDRLLEIDGLSVEYQSPDRSIKALRNVSISLNEGETLGIAGESGSGKSTLALAILQYLGDNGSVTDGSISFKDQSLLESSQEELHSIRGNEIAHVPQNPQTSLNPSITVGEQIAEVLRLHQGKSSSEAKEEVIEILRQVNISDPEENYDRYPHELSGGMQQRVLIAMALSCNPELLILDEPTTGLDVTTQSKILSLINELKDGFNTSIVLITHDLGVLAETSDQVAILYAGELVEKGAVSDIFSNPANPYTQGLLAATPGIGNERELKPIPGNIPNLDHVPDGCIFADRCEFVEEECRTGQINLESVDEGSEHVTRCRRWDHVVDEPLGTAESDWSTSGMVEEAYDDGQKILEAKNLTKSFGESSLLDQVFGGEQPVQAVNGVNVDVYESETVGIVGESGCGKSTLGRLLVQLLDQDEGTIEFRGKDISDASETFDKFRKDTSIVFQNPDSSLNPQKRVYSILERPLDLLGGDGEQDKDEAISELLTQVGLGPEYATKYPSALSGGEKQRVGIARAFASNPKFVVLDEPVASLDASVQANILGLLQDLKAEYNTSYLLISHDLSVVNHICDRVGVMYLGKIVEIGRKSDVFNPPYHPYTQALLSTVPSMDPKDNRERIHLEGDVPSARNPPNGCSFHSRCPKKMGDECERTAPELEETNTSDREHIRHRISCHLDEGEMSNPVREE